MARAHLRIAVEGPAGPVPTLLFTPERADGIVPLVLFGHGANTGKDDAVMQMIVTSLVEAVGVAVAIIDCPEHGERRRDGIDDDAAEGRVRASIADPATTEQLVQEWSEVITCSRPHAPGPVAYVGFSMGAVYGMSTVHAISDVRAAVFALGGLLAVDPGNEARNQAIRHGAAALEDREVLMVNMTNDEHFAMAGALEVFETIPGPRRMAVYSGGHVDVPPEALGVIVHFLRRTLRAEER